MPSDALDRAKEAAGKLAYGELRELQTHLDAVIGQKKQQEIDRLVQEAQALGIDLRALTRKASPAPTHKAGTSRKAKVWYRHPDNPELVWRGKGKRPAWLQEMMDRGDDVIGLRIEPEE